MGLYILHLLTFSDHQIFLISEEYSVLNPTFVFSNMKSSKLVIVPTFNEMENIQDLIVEVMALPENFDLLVIDDSSPDGTASLVKQMQETFPDRLFLIIRIGTAYLEGFAYALKMGYTYIFEMDADFSHNPQDLSLLYSAAVKGSHDLVIGSRYVSGVNVVNWPMGRVLMSFFASKYVQFITGIPIKDTTAGFVCYHRKVLEAIPLNKVKFIGYAFQIEMKFTAWKMGFDILEVPIIFTDRTRGTSKMSKHIFREAILGVIYMKVKSMFVKPKKAKEQSII